MLQSWNARPSISNVRCPSASSPFDTSTLSLNSCGSLIDRSARLTTRMAVIFWNELLVQQKKHEMVILRIVATHPKVFRRTELAVQCYCPCFPERKYDSRRIESNDRVHHRKPSAFNRGPRAGPSGPSRISRMVERSYCTGCPLVGLAVPKTGQSRQVLPGLAKAERNVSKAGAASAAHHHWQVAASSDTRDLRRIP